MTVLFTCISLWHSTKRSFSLSLHCIQCTYKVRLKRFLSTDTNTSVTGFLILNISLQVLKRNQAKKKQVSLELTL